MGKWKIGTILQYLVFLGLGLGLIWYSARDLTPDQVQQIQSSWRKADLRYVIPVFGMLLLAHYSRALRWRILMKPLGYHPSATNTFLAVLLGYFFNLLVPRLGEVMKCTVLARYEKVAPDKLVGTILTERLVDVVCLLAITGIMVLFQFDLLGQYLWAKIASLLQSKTGSFSPIKISVALAAVAALWVGGRILLRKYAHLKAVQKITGVFRGITAGIASFTRIENKLAFWGHTLLIWAMYLGGVWMGFLSFAPVSHLGAGATVTALVFGSFGMVATQGGIGAFQIATQKALSFYGIEAVNGLAFGWLMWIAQTGIVLLAGIAALLLLPAYNLRRTAAKPHA